jgi:NADH-quinone oxidoreductase subunit H
MASQLWLTINRQTERLFEVGAKVGLWFWEKTGRNAGLVFFGGLAHMILGLLVGGYVAHLLWNRIFDDATLKGMSDTGRFLVAFIPIVVKGVLLLTFVALSALFWIWLERKVAGRMQSRLGPMHTGGWHGWSQTLADGIKLLGKEDLVPRDADKALFLFAPYLVFVGAVLPFMALPFGFGPTTIAVDVNIGVFFIVATMSLEVIGVVLAGWASNNKWSVYGGLREAAQVVVYEIPLGITLLIPIVYAGSMQMTVISEAQNGPIWNWFLFRDPFSFIAFFIFFVTALASCKRAPFDLPEAESELVSGFHTEYSGLRWSFFFMAEYGAMYLVSAVAVVLWLGGPNIGIFPYKPTADGSTLSVVLKLLGPFVILTKASILVFVQMWVRWTLPRIRLDQMLYMCIKVLLPAALLCLTGTCLWKWLLNPAAAGSSFGTALSAHPVGAIVDIAGRAVLVLIFLYCNAKLIWWAWDARRVSRQDEKSFGSAWRTWGARATSDYWGAGYEWKDPALKKPEQA